MDNGIGTRQNAPGNIRLLAAQRAFYARAKVIAAVQASMAGLCPLAGAILTAFRPEADVWAALAGIVAAVADTAWLDPKQTELRKCGANTQETFDTNVLNLDSNEVLLGPCSTGEDVYEAAKAGAGQNSSALVDWYPKSASSVPLPEGRLICQRTNLWWDSKLRRRYRGWIIVAVCLASVVVICIGLHEQWSMRRFVLAAIAPLLPALMWSTRECKRQKDGAAELDRLREYAEQLWKRVLANQISAVELTQCSNELQVAILVGRRERAVVFDWVYGLLRDSQEEQMNVNADTMAEEFANRTP